MLPSESIPAIKRIKLSGETWYLLLWQESRQKKKKNHTSSIPASTHRGFPKGRVPPWKARPSGRETLQWSSYPSCNQGQWLWGEVTHLWLMGFCRTQLALGTTRSHPQRASHIKQQPWLLIPGLGNSFSIASLPAIKTNLYKFEKKD